MDLQLGDLLAVDDPDAVGDLREWADVELTGLGRSADITVWLPPSYERGEPAQRYPVIYAHDGGNMFVKSRSFAGATWSAGEAMAILAADGLEAIVVAIPCHPTERGEEYSPYAHPDLGGGRADYYVRFLADHLKPAVDAVLPTQPGPESTVTLGSSLGGVVSAHLWSSRPEVFGGAGLFSPAFWWPGESALCDLERAVTRRPMAQRASSDRANIDPAGHTRRVHRLYVDVGGREQPGEPEIEAAYVRDAERIVHACREAGLPVRYVYDSAAVHFETEWAERFPTAVRWLLEGWSC